AGWRSTYAPTWAFKADSQAEADLVAVKAGESTKVRNVQLAPGGTVTGVITDQFGQPVEGAWVDIEGNFPGRAGPGEGRYSGQTDANGRYVVNGVPAGDYTPLVYSHDYAPEWSGDADHPSAATPIRVKALKESTFDAQLAPGARLTGEVVNADGSPLSEYVVLDVFTADGRLIGDMDASADTGAFMSSPLPAGEFVIRAGLVDSSVDVWFDAATSREDATVVTLSRGEQMEITFHLP
ncbi:MAG TPA: carboxypeptidase-like regulatory domain-containing protein, partial [Jiangellaceae bacterium]|nr:carboxypeptidase-like regulatory domain-containing protein [Jiangellaceae bacterium]